MCVFMYVYCQFLPFSRHTHAHMYHCVSLSPNSGYIPAYMTEHKHSSTAHNMYTWQVTWLHIIIITFGTFIFYCCCCGCSSRLMDDIVILYFSTRFSVCYRRIFFSQSFFLFRPNCFDVLFPYLLVNRAMTTMLIIAEHGQQTFILIITQEFGFNTPKWEWEIFVEDPSHRIHLELLSWIFCRALCRVQQQTANSHTVLLHSFRIIMYRDAFQLFATVYWIPNCENRREAKR